MTAVEFLEDKLMNHPYGGVYFPNNPKQLFDQAKAMEKEQKGYSKEEVDNLLNKLLENNMCSHAGDELIEQFKKN